MKLITLAANLLLVATAALASPLSAREQAASPLSARKQAIMDALRARSSFRRSNAFRAGPDNANGTADATSVNWGGVAISQPGVTEVSGTFTVPQPRVPPGGDSGASYCGVAWVGIDGWNNGDLIQTGALWCVFEDETFFEPWYEYLPAPITPYEGVTISAGSVVSVTATKTGANSGFTTLTVDGITVSHTFPEEGYFLPGTSAEWIVEDYEISVSGPPFVAFADFGSVTFTGATAVINGATVTPGEADALIIDLTQNGAALTSSTISNSTVTVNYI